MKQNNEQKGLIGIIIIIVIALIALKYYFDIDFKTLVQNKIIQDLWALVKQIGVLIWKVIVIILDLFRLIFDKIKNLFS